MIMKPSLPRSTEAILIFSLIHSIGGVWHGGGEGSGEDGAKVE